MTGAEVLLAEIGEQPGVLERIRGDGAIPELAARLAAEPPSLVRLAAHGSSDNAATYGVYAFGRLAGRTALRDSISMPVYDGVRWARAASSRSRSRSRRDARRRHLAAGDGRGGRTTVAITNGRARRSPARPRRSCRWERARSARSPPPRPTRPSSRCSRGWPRTRAAAGRRSTTRSARRSSWRARRSPALPAVVEPVAEALAWAERLMVTARGPEFATAREIALKLTELCRLGGVAMTATDLAHGPIAALDERFPVWISAARDGSLEAVREAVERIAAWAPRSSPPAPARPRSAPATRSSSARARPAALAAAVRAPGPALRRGARPRQAPRRRRPAQPAQGHARALTYPRLLHCPPSSTGRAPVL